MSCGFGFHTSPSTSIGSDRMNYFDPITSAAYNLDGTQKGNYNVYPAERDSEQIFTLLKDRYVKGDIIHLERWGAGSVEIVAEADVRIYGVRNIDNRYFIMDTGSGISLLCRGDNRFTILGRLADGYNGAIKVYSYSQLKPNETRDVTVIGENFSDNMQVWVTDGDASIDNINVVNSKTCILTMTSTGVEGGLVSLLFFNGEDTIAENAITLTNVAQMPSDLFTFEVGWGACRLSNLRQYMLRAKRSSDDEVTDIEPNPDGKFKLDCPVSGGMDLGSWLGTSDLFLVALYNQGTLGQEYDFVVDDSLKEFKLANAGVLIEELGRRMFEMDGINDQMTTVLGRSWVNGPLTILSNTIPKTVHNGIMLSAWAASPARNFQYRTMDTGNFRFTVVNNLGSAEFYDEGPYSANTYYQLAMWKGNDELNISINGVPGEGTSMPTDYDSPQKMDMGTIADGQSPFNGFGNYMIACLSYPFETGVLELSEVETLLDNLCTP